MKLAVAVEIGAAVTSAFRAGMTTAQTSAARLDQTVSDLQARAATVEGWRKAKAAVSDTKAAYDAARAKAAALTAQVAASAAPLQAATAASTQAKAAVIDSKTAYEAARVKAEALEKQLAATTRPTKKLAAASEEARAAMAQAKATYEAARVKADQLGKELTAAAANTKQLTAASEAAKAAVGRTAAGYRANLEHLRSMSDAAKAAKIDLKAVGEEATRTADQLARATAARSALHSATERRTARRESLSAMGGEIVSAGASAMSFAAPIMQAADYQERVVRFGNTAQMAADDLTKVRDRIEEVSRQTGQSQNNLLEGLEILVGRGMDPTAALESLGSIGKGATATKAAMEDMAGVAFALQTSLGIKPTGLAQSLDSLAQSGKSGGFELDKMAKFLPSLTAQAQLLGMQGAGAVASLGASLQIAFKGTGDADAAANNMKNFLSKITSEDAVKNFADMGINLEQELKAAMASGEDPILFMIQRINDLTGGDAFKLSKLFGDQQVKEFILPMMQNFEEFKKIKDDALSSSGVIDKDFEKVSGLFNYQLSRMQNAVTGFSQRSGGSMLDTLGHIAGGVASVINTVADLSAQFPGLTSVVMYGAAALVTYKVGSLAVRLAINGIRAPLDDAAVMFARVRAATASGAVSSNRFAGALAGVRRAGSGGLGGMLGQVTRLRSAMLAVPTRSFAAGLRMLGAAGALGAASVSGVGRASMGMGRGLMFVAGAPVRAVIMGLRMVGVASLTNPITALPAILGFVASAVIENWDAISAYLMPKIAEAKKYIQWAANLVGIDMGSDDTATADAGATGEKPKVDTGVLRQGLDGAMADMAVDGDAGADIDVPAGGDMAADGPAYAGGGGGATITNHNRYDITITAGPGADPEAIAQMVMDRISRAQGGRASPSAGGALYDGV